MLSNRLLLVCPLLGFSPAANAMEGRDAQEGSAPLSIAPSGLESRVRAYLRELHARSRFPGGSAALILPDGAELALSVGWADRERERAMTPADRMFSGSIGKTYFAAMAVKLWLAGELELDAPVSRWLEDDERVMRLPNADELTVEQLLRHQSGLPRYVLRPEFWRDLLAAPDRSWVAGDQLAYVADAEPVHPAGEGWAYSDTNYIVLGLILERVSEVSVYDYVRQQFVEPFELGVTLPSTERRLPGLAQGYPTLFRDLGVPELAVVDGLYAFDPDFEWCGGGFLNTPRSLARWALALYGGSVLGGEAVAQMVAEAAPARMLGPGARYGLGVIVRDTDAGRLLGHDGVFPGYTSVMGYFEDSGIAAAFQINTDGPATDVRLHEVLVELAKLAGER